jgi:hypothetical protein
MPHYLLQANENQWILVREIPSSQKFKGTTSDGDELGVDVHYTMPKILRLRRPLERQCQRLTGKRYGQRHHQSNGQGLPARDSRSPE